MNYNNFETHDDAVAWMTAHQGMSKYRNMRLTEISLGRWRYRVYFDR